MELSAAAFTHAASVNVSVDVLDHICVYSDTKTYSTTAIYSAWFARTLQYSAI